MSKLPKCFYDENFWSKKVQDFFIVSSFMPLNRPVPRHPREETTFPIVIILELLREISLRLFSSIWIYPASHRNSTQSQTLYSRIIIDGGVIIRSLSNHDDYRDDDDRK